MSIGTFGLIVFARLGSQRLPGKALRPIAGVPLLHWVIANARPAAPTATVVATSDASADDALADWCRANGVSVFRGPLDDVAGRALACARAFGFDAFARVNGDSPFVDPALIALASRLLDESGCAFVTNLRPRRWPYGVAAEVVRTGAFATLLDEMRAPEDREHVTTYLYRNLAAMDHRRLERDDDLSRYHLAIDTPADLAWFERYIAGRHPEPGQLDYMDAIDWIENEPAQDRHHL